MARLRLAALAVLFVGLVLVCPSTGAFVKANGKKDLTAVCNCLRKDGRFTTWLQYFESSGAAPAGRRLWPLPLSRHLALVPRCP